MTYQYVKRLHISFFSVWFVLLGMIHVPGLLAQDSKSSQITRAVVICIHGVRSNADNSYSEIEKLQGFGESESTMLLKFDWGTEGGDLAASRVGNRCDQFGGMSRFQWAAAAKLKDLVAQLRSKNIINNQTKVSVVSHSQGTVVTLAALQEGLRLDNWILMGSPLDRIRVSNGSDNTDFLNACKNVSGVTYNLHSKSDDPVGVTFHIGNRGLPMIFRNEPKNNWRWLTRSKQIQPHEQTTARSWSFQENQNFNERFHGIVNVPIRNVDHGGERDSYLGGGWWSMFWTTSENVELWPEGISWNDIARSLVVMGRGGTFTTEERKIGMELAEVPISSTWWRSFSGGAASNSRTNQPWEGFGWPAEGRKFKRKFTISKDSETGFHFDDAENVKFTISVEEGEVSYELKTATWYDWHDQNATVGSNLRSKSVRKGEEVTGDWSTPNLDRTVYLQLIGESEAPAVVTCEIVAGINLSKLELRKRPHRAEESLALDRALQSAREPMFTRQEVESTSLLADGLAAAYEANGEGFLSEFGTLEKQPLLTGLYSNRSSLVSVLMERKDSNRLLLRTLEYIEPFPSSSSESSSGDPFTRGHKNYLEILQAHKDELASMVGDDSKGNETFHLHKGLVELVRSYQLIEGDLKLEMEKLRNANRLTADRIRFAANKAMQQIANDRAYLRQCNAWRLQDNQIKSEVTQLLSSHPSYRSFQLALEKFPAIEHSFVEGQVDSVLPLAGDVDSDDPLMERIEKWSTRSDVPRDSSGRVFVTQEDRQLIWVRENRSHVVAGLDLIVSTVHRLARRDAELEVKNHFFGVGTSIRVPHEAYEAGKAHLEFVITQKELSEEVELSAEVSFCLPNQRVADVQRVGGYRGEDNAMEKSVTRAVFEKIPLNIRMKHLRMDSSRTSSLGKILWAYQESSVRTVLHSSVGHSHSVSVASKFEESVFDREISAALSQALFFEPNPNRSFSQLHDNGNAIHEFLTRIGLPESIVCGVSGVRIDQKLQWIDLTLDVEIPFVANKFNVPLRIDFSSGDLDEAKIFNSISKQIQEVLVSKFNSSSQDQSCVFSLSPNAAFLARRFRFELNSEAQRIELTFDADLQLRGEESTFRNLCQWQLKGALGKEGKQSNLLSFRLPESDYAIELISAKMIEGEVGISDFLSIESARDSADDVVAKDANNQVVSAVLERVLQDFKALKLTRAALSATNDGPVLTFELGSPSKRFQSIQENIRLDHFDADFGGVAKRVGRVLGERAVLDWLGMHIESARDGVLNSIATELSGLKLNAGMATITFGECVFNRNAQDGKGPCITVEEVQIGLPEEVSQESLKLQRLRIFIGEKVQLDPGGDLANQMKSLLTDQTKCRFDWSEAKISNPAVFGRQRDLVNNKGIRIQVEPPQFVIINESIDPTAASMKKIGLGFTARVVCDALPTELPRMRYVVLVEGRTFFQVEKVTGESAAWENVNGESFISEVSLKMLSGIASERISGVRLDLLGLGEWFFADSSSETGDRKQPLVLRSVENGAVEIIANGSFVIQGKKLPASVNLRTGAVEWNENDTIKSLLGDLLAGSVGLPITVTKIETIKDKKEVGFKFDINVNLGNELGSFEAKGIKGTTRGLRLPSTICWTSPLPLAVGPAVWLNKPSVQIPLDGSARIGASGNLAFPEANFDKLATVKCDLTIEREAQGLIATAKGTTILFSIIPVHENDGTLFIGSDKLTCEMSARTVGPMRAIMASNQSLDIDTGKGVMTMKGNVGVLGIRLANARFVYGKKNRSMENAAVERPVSIRFEGEASLFGATTDVLVEVQDGFGGLDGVASVSLGKVLGVDLSRIDAELHEYHSRIKFSAMGLFVDVYGPGPRDLTAFWLKEQVRSIVGNLLRDLIDPDRLAAAAKEILSGKITVSVGGTLGGRVESRASGFVSSHPSQGGTESVDTSESDTTGGAEIEKRKMDEGEESSTDIVSKETSEQGTPSTNGTFMERIVETVKRDGDPFDDPWDAELCWIFIDHGGQHFEIRRTEKVFKDRPVKRSYYLALSNDHRRLVTAAPLTKISSYLILTPNSGDEAFVALKPGLKVEGSETVTASKLFHIRKEDVDLNHIENAIKAATGLDANFVNSIISTAKNGQLQGYVNFSDFETMHIWQKLLTQIAMKDGEERTVWIDQIDDRTLLDNISVNADGRESVYYITKVEKSQWEIDDSSEKGEFKKVATFNYIEAIDRLSGVVRMEVKNEGSLGAIFRELTNNTEWLKNLARLVIVSNNGDRRQISFYELIGGVDGKATDILVCSVDQNDPNVMELISLNDPTKRLRLHESGVAAGLSQLHLCAVPESEISTKLLSVFAENAKSGYTVECFRQSVPKDGAGRTFITCSSLGTENWTFSVTVEDSETSSTSLNCDGKSVARAFSDWQMKGYVKEKFNHKDLSERVSQVEFLWILLDARSSITWEDYFELNPLGLCLRDERAEKQ